MSQSFLIATLGATLAGATLAGATLAGATVIGAPLVGAPSTDVALAAAPGGAADVHLRGGIVSPGDGLSDADLRRAGRDIFLVRSPGDPAALRGALTQAGGEILTYLPDRAFLVRIPGEALARGRGAMNLDFVGPWAPQYKIAPELRGQPEGALVIHLFPGGDANALASRLRADGNEVTQSGATAFPRVAIRHAAGVDLDALAQDPDVFFMEARGEARLLNAQAVPILQSGANDGEAPIHDRGLLGQDQIVGFLDTGLDFDSCFFRDVTGLEPVVNVDGETAVGQAHRKVHAYDMIWVADDPSDPRDYDNHGHGTHVAGNIGGAMPAPPESTQNGVAPAARFVVQDGGYGGTDNCADLAGLGCPVVDLVPIFEQAYAQGARIHNNSWGDNENSSAQWTYSAGSQDMDTLVSDKRDFLVIFAAGNSGPGAGSVGSPSTAKNVLAVGGSMNGTSLERVISFSSRGPTADGRLKPEVMAPASNTSAAADGDVGTDNCGLDTGAGTSYAAPLVAGAAALVRQYYTEGYYPTGAPALRDAFNPTAALLKGTLVASALSMERAGDIPNMDQGFGRVALAQALAFEDSPFDLKIIDGDVAFASSQEGAYTLDIDVRSSSEPLKVVLTWTDPPSNPAAATNLINDLDLSVSSGPLSYQGNVMRRGRSVPGGAADRLNNLEVVYLPAPRPGRYTVTITPHLIPEGPQDFALVVRGDLAP